MQGQVVSPFWTRHECQCEGGGRGGLALARGGNLVQHAAAQSAAEGAVDDRMPRASKVAASPARPVDASTVPSFRRSRSSRGGASAEET